MYVSSSSTFFRRTAIAAILATTSLSLVSLNDAHADEPAVAPPKPAAQHGSADDLAEQAFKSYETGAYADSISLYVRAYDISKDARILFNIAQIYDKKLQDRDLALSYYRRYLKTETQEPELSKRAVDRVAALSANDRTTVTPSSEQKQAPASNASQEKSSSAPIWIGWIATGVLAAGAVTCGIIASTSASDLKDASFAGEAPTGVSDDRSRVKTFSLATDILAGTAIVAGGVTLYLTLTQSKSSSKSARAFLERNTWLTGRF